jgi:hypothetical protein
MQKQPMFMQNSIDLRSSTIDKLIGSVNSLLGKLFGPAIEETGLLLSDSVKIWRLKNQLTNLEKVNEIVRKKNIPIGKVNIKVLMSYLDGVSVEDDQILQEMWAHLLTHYIDANSNITINVFPDLLRQLSSHDVQILKYMVQNGGLEINYYGNTDKKIEFENYELDNLARLGLIEQISDFSVYSDCGYDEPKFNVEELSPKGFQLTDMGEKLLKICEVI